MNHSHKEPASAQPAAEPIIEQCAAACDEVADSLSDMASAGARECAKKLRGQIMVNRGLAAAEPIHSGREADIAAIRHTLMTGLSHNAAIAALDRLAALGSMTPGDYLPHEEGTT